MRRERIGRLGGAIGVVVAVAGGFGAAVGFYQLPDPGGVGISADAYGRADQRAIAVSRVEDGNGNATVLRIDANRSASAGTEVLVPGDPPTPMTDANVWFNAVVQSCTPDGECSEEQQWNGSFPSEAFHFDPRMDTATFSGIVPEVVNGVPTGSTCQFDVMWAGEGLIAPFAGYPGSSTSVGPWNAGARVDDAYAEVSRVAPADISAPSCLGDALENVNGYLSMGVRRAFARGTTGFD